MKDKAQNNTIPVPVEAGLNYTSPESAGADIISFHRLDERLTILYVNPGAQAILGYSSNELIGKSVLDFLDSHDHERVSTLMHWISPDNDYTGQVRFQTKDHAWLWLEVKVVLLADSGRSEILFVSRDITPRQLPEPLQIEDASYRAIVEDQTELICRFLPSTRLTFVNEAFCRYFQQTREQLIGTSFLNLFADRNLEQTKALLQSLTVDNPVVTYEQRVLRPDNNIRWLQVTHRAIFDKVSFLEYQSVGHDITERKQAEIALKESERRLADIINFLPDPTYAIDINGRLIAWNRAVEETTGVEAPQMLGKGDYEYSLKFYGSRKPILIDLVLHPDLDLEKHYHEYTFIPTRGQSLVAEVYVPNWNGKMSYLWCIANPLYDTNGNLVGAIESVRDITDRKQTERALQQSEEKYRTLFKTMNEGLALLEAVVDHEGTLSDFRYIDVNPVFEKMIGYHRSQLIGRKVREIFSDEKASLRLEQYYKVVLTSKPVEFHWYEPGLGKHFEVIAFSPGEGQCAALFIDITTRKQTEQALRLSEEKFSKAFSSSPNLIILSDIGEGHFIDVNDNFCTITGYSREEVMNQSALELKLWLDPAEGLEFKRLLQQDGYIRNQEIHLCHKSGQEIIGLGSAELINITGKQYMIGTMVDITERKQLEADMARLDRLNLVGEIAASIGHEIRNPLTTVRGFLQMLGSEEEYLRDTPYFEIMIEEIDRANAIITEFLSLAKDKKVDFKKHNLNAILANVYPLIHADAVGQDKYVKLELDRIPDLLVDEKEIRQLLLNLVRNGMDAMEAGGTITIKTFKKNKNVILAVSDQGSGIPLENLDKLGTPFFTTKEDGTGLGLSVCYSIAARHNANIQIETGSTGTTFYVHFKLAASMSPAVACTACS